MKTWQKLPLFVAAVLVMVGAEKKHQNIEVCEYDQPNVSDSYKRNLLHNKVGRCFTEKIDEGKSNEIKESPTLENFRNLFRDFCPHVQEVTACITDVRNSVANCKVKNFTRSSLVLFELTEHLVTAGCENSGERLAHIVRGGYIFLNRDGINNPLKQCLYKSTPLLNLRDPINIDLTSETYLIYQDFARIKSCLKFTEDEAFKSAGQWLLDEIAAYMKCKHPDEDSMVLCSELDVSKVPIKSICHLEILSTELMYNRNENPTEQDTKDTLLKKLIWSGVDDSFASNCYHYFFSHDYHARSNYTDLEFLKEEYERVCKEQRENSDCLLKISHHGELCLPQEENKEFQLMVQAAENYMSRLCVEDGVFLANVMHEVYKNGNAFADCYEVVTNAAKANVGYASLNTNMKYYVDSGVYMKCVVGRLSANNELASNLEIAFNDILKKMKCVHPEDHSVVLCETLS